MKRFMVLVLVVLMGFMAYGQDTIISDGDGDGDGGFVVTVPSTTEAIRTVTVQDLTASMKTILTEAEGFGVRKQVVANLLLMAYYDGRKDACNQAMLEASMLKDIVLGHDAENSATDIALTMVGAMQAHKEKAVIDKQEIAMSMLRAMGAPK